MLLSKDPEVSGTIGEDVLINTKYPLTRVSRGLHATHWVAKASVVREIPGVPRFGVKGSFMGPVLYRRHHKARTFERQPAECQERLGS